MNALLSIWTWLEIALVAMVGFWVQLLLFLFTWPFDRGRRIAGRFFRLMAVLCSKLTPYWDFAVEGPVPATLPRRLVVVGNHESQVDPFLISYLPWEMKWLGKAVLFKIPFVGWSMGLAGDIPVRRGEQRSAKSAMALCAQWVSRGVPVMIFPEGTRSAEGELLPFKDGAFRLAIETQSAVLPIAVAGTRRALPKHAWRFSRSRARVMVGTPLSTDGLTLADLDRLKAAAREQVAALRARLVAALPPAQT